MEKLTVVDNNVGIFSMVFGFLVFVYLYENKKIIIFKSLIVGKFFVFDCVNDKMDFLLFYFILRRIFDKFWRIGIAGRIGIGLTIFSFGFNNLSEKFFIGIMVYNVIVGFIIIIGESYLVFGVS